MIFPVPERRLLAALAPWVLALATHASQVGDQHAAAVAARLRPSAGGAEVATPAPNELARLGSERVPAMLDALATGRLSIQPADAADAALSEAEREALFEALASFRASILVPHLTQLLESPEGESGGGPRGDLVLGLLARVGGPSDLDLARAAAGEGDEHGVLERTTEAKLERAVEGILLRHPAGFRPLEREIADSIPAVAAAMVAGAAATGAPEALQLAADLLDFQPELEELLLARIGALSAQLPHPPEHSLQAAVRERLRSDDAALARVAALTAGRLEDYDALEDLIELLVHPEPSVRDAARWSLEHLSGTTLSTERTAWIAWLASERTWFSTEAEACIEALDHALPGRAAQAFEELSQHRFRRDRIAQVIGERGEHPDPDRRRLAHRALGKLGSPAGMRYLLAGLQDHDEDAARAAFEAVQLLCGAELPPEAAAWRDAHPPERVPKP